MVVALFLTIVAATKFKQIAELIHRIKSALALLTDGGKNKKD
jgi:hypothetical protein